MTATPEIEILASELADAASPPANLRHNGKIARLPKETRDMLIHTLCHQSNSALRVEKHRLSQELLAAHSAIKPNQGESSPGTNFSPSAASLSISVHPG
ncbi:MAG TPA: hypothetical protein VNZ64_25640 [Candidatus Acidoferrum sp.]|jgi:hypothetical protein|nr:hypothetical protein [Candidatus Acidoferrum sp.]